MEKGERMGRVSPLIEAGLRSRAGKNKLGCLPLGIGITLCGALLEMTKVMDFTALNAYLTAAFKILIGK